MKPTCSGHFTPMRDTACCACAHRAVCAFKSSPENGFVVLPMPRMRKAFTRREVIPTISSTRAMAEASAQLVAAGYARKGDSVIAGTRKVAEIKPGYGSTFRLEFAHISTRGLRSLRAADRVDVRPVVDTTTTVTHKSTVAQMRLRHRGCFAVCLEANDAVALLRAAAKAFFEDYYDRAAK